MDLLDIYDGVIEWAEYLRTRPPIPAGDKCVDEALVSADAGRESSPESLRLALTPGDYSTALESGIGAIGSALTEAGGNGPYNIEVSMDKLAGGLDSLNADFHLLLGDIVWKLEMRQHALDILAEIRLAEFEREARAYRTRAENAYVNGWYEEAVADFLEAEKRNYPDFVVHRSIANIYLYHLIDLPAALDYFRKAAKYARPTDARHSAEAHYFAGVVCLLERRLDEAASEMLEASTLNPDLHEARYQHACIAALRSDATTAIASLEAAISGDPRYHERARNDRAFSSVRLRVDDLLDGLMKPLHDRLAEAQRSLKPQGYVIAGSDEARVAQLLAEAERRIEEAQTYKSGLDCLEDLSRCQDQINELYDSFHKRYQIDLTDHVRCVAFSPNGRLLAAGFLTGAVRIWDVYAGLNTLSIEAHSGSVSSVAFSPNGELLASASRDKTVKLWDVTSGGEIHTLHGHDGEVRSVAFSPDGDWIASGGHDRTVRIWRTITGHEAQTLTGHKHQVTSVVFSPIGRLVASASMDKTIKLWDVKTGREIQTLFGHTKGVESLAFTPDGKLLASGGVEREIKIWDTSGRELQTLEGLPNDVTSLAFSPDGHLIAAGSLGKTIKVWRLAAGEVIKTVRFSDIGYHSVAFSPRGEWLAFGSRNLQLWLKVILTEEEYAAVKAGEAVSHIDGDSLAARWLHGPA